MCMKCRGLYGKGGWDKDPEGNDEFCRYDIDHYKKPRLMWFIDLRWCSEGGQIYLCDFCPHAFCNKCLRWNLGRLVLISLTDFKR